MRSIASSSTGSRASEERNKGARLGCGNPELNIRSVMPNLEDHLFEITSDGDTLLTTRT